VNFKRKFGDRVTLILGNRDVNKLLLYPTLHKETIESKILLDVYWDPMHKTYDEYMSLQPSPAPPHSRVTVLKWMLCCAMGCPTTFETRRTELEILENVKKCVSDEQVVDSFVDSVDPSGADPFMLDYCKLGVIMAVHNTSLFVHGGVSAIALNSVPDNTNTNPSVKLKVKQWADKLNAWKDEQIAAYIANPLEQAGFAKLLNYGVPGGNSSRTVMYNNHLHNGNCTPPDPEVVAYCFNNSISRIFVGHQPHGECPSVIREKDLTIFLCDTSYSDLTASKTNGNVSNNRGGCYSNIQIGRSWTHVKGVIKNGEKLEYLLQVDAGDNCAECGVIGKMLKGGGWVKGLVADGRIMTAKGVGYALDVEVVKFQDLDELN